MQILTPTIDSVLNGFEKTVRNLQTVIDNAKDAKLKAVGKREEADKAIVDSLAIETRASNVKTKIEELIR